MKRSALRPGFSLIELMVTIAIIGFMMVLALPSLGNSVRTSRERAVMQKFVQDFTWARGAAGAGDASALAAGLSGPPTLSLVLNADCSWSTTISTTIAAGTLVTPDPVHSMALADVTKQASGIACTSAALGATAALTYPITFNFSSQGYVSASGNVTATGASSQVFKLNILTSGSIIQGNSAS